MNIFEVLIVQPIFNFLLFIYNYVGDFGVAIILLTIVIRLMLWPLVRKQLRQTKLMRKIQPELKKIKAKAKGNKTLQSQMMMELYREKGVKPFSSMLVLLIQLPIFIALVKVVRLLSMNRDQIETYTYGFLQSVGRIPDLLANPETFNENLFNIIDLTRHAIGQGAIYWPALILAVTAAIFQYIQSKQIMPKVEEKKKLRDMFREAANGKEVDQAEMNNAMMSNMTVIFPFMTFFIAIYLPGAVVLYYATTSIVAVIQQWFVLREDEEELEKLAAEKTPASKKAKAREAVIVKQPSKKSSSKKSTKPVKPVKSANSKPAEKSNGATVVRRISAK